MAAPTAHVLRDGEETAIPARDLVPGDIVLLRAGDRVPADARVIEAVNLAVDEAALTGESAAGRKDHRPFRRRRPVARRSTNMTYAGTLVVHGRGQAVVVATGMSTEFGHIARMVETVEAGRTPLQENLDRLGATLGQSRPGRRRARRASSVSCAVFPRSRCSCSASRSPSPSCRRRCLPS